MKKGWLWGHPFVSACLCGKRLCLRPYQNMAAYFLALFTSRDSGYSFTKRS
jgi:hypothetical protein